ncbi:hypothetical protein M5K25_021196 [Dendrobium thyrsiflorum]|uniref:Uncharacterized protein n=1 Tax=Dendrobium thyrsiflorum TaxID=117978 RepID=A0ABD0UIU0_DENTH
MLPPPPKKGVSDKEKGKEIIINEDIIPKDPKKKDNAAKGIDYNILSHLRKIPAQLSIYDALVMDASISVIKAYAGSGQRPGRDFSEPTDFWRLRWGNESWIFGKADEVVDKTLPRDFALILRGLYDLSSDGGGMDDGPDQDPMVPSSRAIVVLGLLSQRRFDAIGEHTGADHNRNIVMPFGGESPSSEGPGEVVEASFAKKIRTCTQARRLEVGSAVEGSSVVERSPDRSFGWSLGGVIGRWSLADVRELLREDSRLLKAERFRSGVGETQDVQLLRHDSDDVLDALAKSISLSEVVWATTRANFLDLRVVAFGFEMFRWQRPDDLSPSEPSEDAIWEVIDRQDSQGSVDVRDRLEQHQDMLQGRNTFHSFFTWFPLLPECSEDSVEFEDPDRWVTSLRLQCGEYHPLESSVAQIGWGTCDVLEPAADTVESSPVSGYICWAQYVLWEHRGTLQEAGIYEAIYASLFDYGRLPTSWARGLAEFWDASRSTFWVGAAELTVTLSDMQTVSGLPIFCHRFEECDPPDEQLFRRVPSADGDRRGRLLLSDVYPIVLQHYRQTYRASDLSRRVRASMPVSVWVRSLLQGGVLVFCYSVTARPVWLQFTARYSVVRGEYRAFFHWLYFSRVTWCQGGLALSGVSSHLALVGSLRCSVLLAASQLAPGQRLALAPAVLTRVYRVLRTISEASSLETSSTFESERIRFFFFAPQLVSNRFSLIHQSDVFSLSPHQRGTVVVDGVDHGWIRTLLLSRQSLTVTEYLISIRPGWLCYRAGASVTLEGYQPNRVVRQFGFFQATAYDGRPLVPGVVDTRRMGTVPLKTRLYAAALSWLHLLRLGTGSSFLLAQPSAHTGVSYTRLAWIRQSFGPTLEHGARRYERRVQELRLPRGRRSRRGHSETVDGTGAEACTTTGTVVPSSARALDVAPAPPCTEVPRSSRWRAGSQYTTSSRRSVDARPSPRDLVESPQEPRRSDFTGYSTPGPSDDFSFPVDSYGSFFFWETSGAAAASPTELFGGPSHTQTTTDLMPTEYSFPASYSADPAALEGFDYSSEIPCYVPMPPNLRTTDRCHHLVVLLRDWVSSIDPRSPESWVRFTSSAGRLLGLFADFGVDTTELAFWEAVCREVESCIWKLRSLSVTRVRVTLPQLEEMVASRRTTADDTHDRLNRSVEALRRHCQSSSGMA